ncbi:MAG: hypothetical protein ACT4OT_18685 [Acidobacteriota bacterium]
MPSHLTVELTRRREFTQASPDESSYETRPPLASNDLLGDAQGRIPLRLWLNEP